jgi:hypothetical protein
MWQALIGEMRNTYRIYFGRTEGKYHFDRLDMNGREILKWIINTQCGREPSIHLAQDWDYGWAYVNMEM